MTRLFLDENELHTLGMGPANVATLRALVKLADTTALDTATTNVGALDTRLTTAEGEIEALQAVNTAIEEIANQAPFVQQLRAAAPTYAPYAGQTVSAGYVQAEAQATDDAVKALAAVVGSLITAIQTAQVLT